MVEKSFEDAMRKLESIVQDLEGGDLPLDESMRKFEQGIALSRFCSKKLDDTENKVNLLLKDQRDKAIEQPFLPDTDADEPSE
jgi:exodeoxyribonuclease VII small subunit